MNDYILNTKPKYKFKRIRWYDKRYLRKFFENSNVDIELTKFNLLKLCNKYERIDLWVHLKRFKKEPYKLKDLDHVVLCLLEGRVFYEV